MDTFGKSGIDAFAVIEFNGAKIKTKVIQDRSPVWYENFSSSPYTPFPLRLSQNAFSLYFFH
jgi:hypothetical protein